MKVLTTKMAYLGPKFTNSHEAAIAVGNGKKLIYLSQYELVRALDNYIADQVILPIYNSSEGQVQWSLDALLNNGKHSVTQEVVRQISHCLIGWGVNKQIRKVISHPQALGQCREFLSKMKLVSTEIAESTASAVEMVSQMRDPTIAAIGNDLAASHYEVPIIARKISNSKNCTRFLVIGGEPRKKTGNDKTTLLIGTANKPGALLRALEVFDALGINMVNLLSQPSPRKVLGECVFFVEVAGHRHDKDLSVALDKIRERVKSLTILGSYPKEF